MRSDDALATILLTSRLLRDDTEPLRSVEFWRLVEAIGHPGAALGISDASATELMGPAGDLVARALALLARGTIMAFELERLEQSGVATLTPFDAAYPVALRDHLGRKTPPILHAAGNTDLFNSPGLGIVGSRDVSPEGAVVARAAASMAVGHGFAVVSGGARGVDQLSMNAAYESDGSVVGVLADSLSRVLRSPDTRRAIHERQTLLCTPYGPNAPFSAGNAMGRNKLIYALASVTLVVASDLGTGGTWSGATEAVKESYGRVAVWRGDGEGPGNGEIETRGGRPVRTIDELSHLLLEPMAVTARQTLGDTQLTLL